MNETLVVPEKNSIHHLVLDLRHYRAWIYWLDLLASALFFWVCLIFLVVFPWNLHAGLLLMVIGSLALYRAALFVHEIGHFKRGTLPSFELAWNALIGWPMLFPSFLIQSHTDHHRVASFGTVNDPEYLPFAAMPQKMRVWFVLVSAPTPLLLIIRAACAVPLSWVSPPLRRWLRSHASRMAMNGSYQPVADAQRLSLWHETSEICSSAFAWGWIIALSSGYLEWQLAAVVFACASLSNVLNAWRTLQAHTYKSTGQATDLFGQVQDTRTFDLPAWLGELLAPVGQRFHAAHHLFPYLPYHSLPLAHKRLMASDWKEKEMYADTLR